MSKCVFTVGSVTHSLKAKRILADNSIPINTTKISSGTGRKGCVYGIEFSCNQRTNISRILANAGIDFEEYTE